MVDFEWLVVGRWRVHANNFNLLLYQYLRCVFADGRIGFIELFLSEVEVESGIKKDHRAGSDVAEGRFGQINDFLTNHIHEKSLPGEPLQREVSNPGKAGSEVHGAIQMSA